MQDNATPTPKPAENIPYEDMTELEQARHRIWGGDGAGMQIHTPQCQRCAWYDRDRPHLARCRVYPRGIPLPILTNKHDHRLPYDGELRIPLRTDRRGLRRRRRWEATRGGAAP